MAITTDTTTLPGQTIITDSNGGVAIDYSAYYSRIATALEGIQSSLGSDSTHVSGILAASTQALENIERSIAEINALVSGPGIKTVDPLAWIGLMSVYKLHVEDPGSMGVDALKAYKAKLDALVASLG